MKRWLIFVCLMLVLVSLAACGGSTAPQSPVAEDEVIGTINGENLYRYEFDFYFNMYFEESFNNYYESLKLVQGVDMLDEESAAGYLGNLETYAWDSIVNMAIIRQMAATDYNITLEPSYMDELLLPEYRVSLLTNRLYMAIFPLIKAEAMAQKSISEEDARAQYESDPAAWDSRQVAHIIMTTQGLDDAAKAEAKAQMEDIIDQLDAGADFAELAKEYSQDGSAAAGGEMDLYFNQTGGGVNQATSFDATFAAAAFDLANIGDYSPEPVETVFGYHIIKLLDEKTGFEAAKDFVIQSNSTITDEEASAYFNQKIQEKLAEAQIERILEYKYYTEEAAEDEAAEEEAAE